MHVRRVVTGHDVDGSSIIVSDGPTPKAMSFSAIPGHAIAQLWMTPSVPLIPGHGTIPSAQLDRVVPQQGSVSLLVVTFPPDNVMSSPTFDAAVAAAEVANAVPDLASAFEPSNPGMHRTDTVDYGIVLSGEIWLELDHGCQTLLRPMDIVVQNGTRHAWHNKSDEISTVAFVMIGASR